MAPKQEKPAVHTVFFTANPGKQVQTPFLVRFRADLDAADKELLQQKVPPASRACPRIPAGLEFENHPQGVLIMCRASAVQDLRSLTDFLVNCIEAYMQETSPDFPRGSVLEIKEYEPGAIVGKCGGDCRQCQSKPVAPVCS